MMTKIEKIDEIYDLLNKSPLSQILPLVYNLALEYEDYMGFLILWYFEKPLAEKPDANREQQQDCAKILLSKGLDPPTVTELEKKAFEKYLLLRYVDKEKICSLSAKEMEDYFKRSDNLIQISEVPEGLHPVDLYFRSQAAEEEKTKLILLRQQIEKQYALLQGYILTKLTYYRTLAMDTERRIAVEKGIKNSNKVFIVHGHNEAKLRELKELLVSENLIPVVLNDQASQGMTIIEKFEAYAGDCAYAFALFTPDDIVESDAGEKYFQARPNVIFELGWFYSHLGRSRVCILSQESEKNEIFSDLQGVLRIQFSKNISERYLEIKRELQSVGIL